MGSGPFRARGAAVVAACVALLAVTIGAAASSAAAPAIRIAYSNEAKGASGIWVAAADGSGASRIGPGGGGLVSPDGTMVAAASPAGGLEILRVGGGTVKLLPFFAKGSWTPLAWSPDSKYVAVAENQGLSGPHLLTVVDIAAGEATLHVRGAAEGASFEPGASDTLVYGLKTSKGANLWEAPAHGTQDPRVVTHNNESAYPVWGAKGIAFDLITPRKNGFPIYQIALLNGSRITQITHTHPSPLVAGPEPVALSANGLDMAARFVGQDPQNDGYSVDLSTGKVTLLTSSQGGVGVDGISSDGTKLLVTLTDLGASPPTAEVATMPFGGGAPTVLIPDASAASWNQ